MGQSTFRWSANGSTNAQAAGGAGTADAEIPPAKDAAATNADQAAERTGTVKTD